MRSVVNVGATVPSGTTLDEMFGNQISGSHQMVTRVDVLFDRVVIVEGLNVVGGAITSDRTAAVLGSCSVQIADPLRVPVSSDDVLTPYGYELRVWRGVRAGGGDLLCPLITAPIQRSSVDGVTLLSSISGQDRSRLVSDAIFEESYQIAKSTNLADAIQQIIEAGVSGLTYNFPTTTYTAPKLTFGPDDNRWAVVQEMARSIGNEILFDGLGVCVMRPEPTFASDPAGTIAEGVNMTGMIVDLDRGPAYNKVIATSSNASLGDTFRGEAEDDDPASPTYYSGPFGKKARRYSSPFLSGDTQCDWAAAAILASNLGVAKSVAATLITDPRLEPSDVVQVTRTALGIDELHIIDRASIGLGATVPMAANVRAQQVAS